jgi:hypothetical protein
VGCASTHEPISEMVSLMFASSIIFQFLRFFALFCFVFVFVFVELHLSLQALKLGDQIKAGIHVQRNENIKAYRGQKILVEPKEPNAKIMVEIDGETAGFLPATFNIVPKSILLVVPKKFIETSSPSSSS